MRLAALDGTWVFHHGALGDGVLLWPMLRALGARGPVTLVADGPRARLAAEAIGLVGLDATLPPWADLWRPGARPSTVAGARKVHAFLGERARGAWLANARAAFPAATVHLHVRRPDGRFARRWSSADPCAAVSAAANPCGPVVLHVGAGSREKRWPMERWVALAAALRADRPRAGVALLAGEVEAEQHDRAERGAFVAAGGVYLGDLVELAEALRLARLFAGGDSGPTHLAAQLGLPVVALFGPSDAQRWAPVGPTVDVIAPPAACPMQWLVTDTVIRRMRALDRAAVSGAGR